MKKRRKKKTILTGKLRDELTEQLDVFIVKVDLVFADDAFGRRFYVRIFHFKAGSVGVIVEGLVRTIA